LRRPGVSAKRKSGRALFGEGFAALDEILNERGLFDNRAEFVAFGGKAANDLRDGDLRAADRGLAQAGEFRGIKHRRAMKLVGGKRAVDEADPQRFDGQDAATAKQRIVGPRRPDKLRQPTRLGKAIEQAEPRRADRKKRVIGAKPESPAGKGPSDLSRL
jgi:hypothetical protein